MVKRLKKIFRYLLYFSLIFVIYYLFRFDYLVFDNLEVRWGIFLLSLLLLWGGFIVSTQSWRRALKIHDISISFNKAVYSHGMSVFGKYIPGKIWVILGRASIISEEKGRLMRLSAISFKEQLVYLFIGLFLSLFLLPFIELQFYLKILIIITAVILGVFLFIRPVHDYFVGLFFKIFKKEPEIPFVSFINALQLSKTILAYWFLWSFAFYIFVISIVPGASVLSAFAFPLSVSYGLIAVIVPGGIGIREGIIILILTNLGMSPELATTVSLIQRLWFITGEVFIFSLAIILKRK